MRRPEINNDELSTYLVELQKEYNPKNILDIGASTGQGSTSYFDKRRCFALEMDKESYDLLEKRYENNKKVTTIHAPSTSVIESADWILEHYKKHPNWLAWKVIGLKEVLKWRDNTQKWIDSFKTPDGIKAIKKRYKIDTFGLVLIDGGPFTANEELNQVWGSKIIVLDDINDIKNWQNYQRLKDSPQYELLRYSHSYRNGFAVFKLK